VQSILTRREAERSTLMAENQSMWSIRIQWT
jgi:hypothetical protein